MSRYKVVGNHAIDGVPPGKFVVIDDEKRARAFIRAGHVVAPKPKPEEVSSDGRVLAD